MSKRIEMIGKQFNYLTVIEQAPKPENSTQRSLFYKCRCECGKESIVNGTKLRNGSTKSCGCHKAKNVLPRFASDHPQWTGYKDIYGTYYSSIKANAKYRKIPFTITIEDMWEQWEKQNGKCNLTGVELVIKNITSAKKANASIDRIDSSLGYTKDNIQFVHRTINYMKQQYDQNDFIGWCKKVTDYQKL